MLKSSREILYLHCHWTNAPNNLQNVMSHTPCVHLLDKWVFWPYYIYASFSWEPKHMLNCPSGWQNTTACLGGKNMSLSALLGAKTHAKVPFLEPKCVLKFPPGWPNTLNRPLGWRKHFKLQRTIQNKKYYETLLLQCLALIIWC